MPDLGAGREQNRGIPPDCPHIRFNLQRPQVNGYALDGKSRFTRAGA